LRGLQQQRARKKIEMRFAHLKGILGLGLLRMRGPEGPRTNSSLLIFRLVREANDDNGYSGMYRLG
jgi:hypothetical protein